MPNALSTGVWIFKSLWFLVYVLCCLHPTTALLNHLFDPHALSQPSTLHDRNCNLKVFRRVKALYTNSTAAAATKTLIWNTQANTHTYSDTQCFVIKSNTAAELCNNRQTRSQCPLYVALRTEILLSFTDDSMNEASTLYRSTSSTCGQNPVPETVFRATDTTTTTINHLYSPSTRQHKEI